MANGSITNELGDEIYSGVVGIDSVCIAFTNWLNSTDYKSVQETFPVLSYSHSARKRSTQLLAQNLGPKLQEKVLYKIGFKPSHGRS